ncbi:MAG: hypothetical protein IJ083_12785 [Clostridia bacterium]|nr:hypothetical protein [Clostridia bacterium]
MPVPEMFSLESFAPEKFEAHHSMDLRGEKVDFTSVCEDFVFYAPDGTPEATIFTISYLRDDATADRPVMFLWNGGPGSATSTLHLECFGPWQIDQQHGQAAFGLHENDQCLLDRCDLVFVDPVGLGLSRLLRHEKAGKFYSVDGDARSVAFLILSWLHRHHRFHSPVYLTGESYGTIRAMRVLAELGRSPFSESRMVPGLPVKGVVLIGMAVEDPAIPSTLSHMPDMAATHWYHLPEKPALQAQFVEEACRFAREEVLPLLFLGEAAGEKQLQDAAERLSGYTGLSQDYWVQNRLLLRSPDDIQKRSLPGYTLDLYDSRNKTPDGEPYQLLGGDNIPLLVMNDLLLPRLGVTSERIYYTGNLNIHAQFSFETEDLPEGLRKSHVDCLREAMERTRDMQVLVASGLYDLCTPAGTTEYILRHSHLPGDRVSFRMYPGGHGIYSSEEGKRTFLEDVRSMLEGQKH